MSIGVELRALRLGDIRVRLHRTVHLLRVERPRHRRRVIQLQQIPFEARIVNRRVYVLRHGVDELADLLLLHLVRELHVTVNRVLHQLLPQVVLLVLLDHAVAVLVESVACEEVLLADHAVPVHVERHVGQVVPPPVVEQLRSRAVLHVQVVPIPADVCLRSDRTPEPRRVARRQTLGGEPFAQRMDSLRSSTFNW